MEKTYSQNVNKGILLLTLITGYIVINMLLTSYYTIPINLLLHLIFIELLHRYISLEKYSIYIDTMQSLRYQWKSKMYPLKLLCLLNKISTWKSPRNIEKKTSSATEHSVFLSSIFFACWCVLGCSMLPTTLHAGVCDHQNASSTQKLWLLREGIDHESRDSC